MRWFGKRKEWLYFSSHYRVSKVTGVRQMLCSAYSVVRYPLDRAKYYNGSEESYKIWIQPQWGNIKWENTGLTLEELKQEAEAFQKLISEKRQKYLEETARRRAVELQKNEETLHALEAIEK